MKPDPSEMFKALSVKTRVRIIELLKTKGPLGVKWISEILKVTPSAVSQHLKLLKQTGFVQNERKGYWIPYSIDEHALENCRLVLSQVCTCGCPAGKMKGRELDKAKLASLMKFKKELEDELKNINKRISEIKDSSKK